MFNTFVVKMSKVPKYYFVWRRLEEDDPKHDFELVLDKINWLEGKVSFSFGLKVSKNGNFRPNRIIK